MTFELFACRASCAFRQRHYWARHAFDRRTLSDFL